MPKYSPELEAKVRLATNSKVVQDLSEPGHHCRIIRHGDIGEYWLEYTNMHMTKDGKPDKRYSQRNRIYFNKDFNKVKYVAKLCKATNGKWLDSIDFIMWSTSKDVTQQIKF